MSNTLVRVVLVLVCHSLIRRDNLKCNFKQLVKIKIFTCKIIARCPFTRTVVGKFQPASFFVENINLASQYGYYSISAHDFKNLSSR